MPAEAVRFVIGRGDVKMSLCTWEPDGLQKLKEERSADLPLAQAVRSKDLEALRDAARSDWFVDCGRKHKAKELSALLLRHTRMPFLCGNYTSVGQLVRSVRTLLLNAQKRDERNVYIIGLEDEVFRQLTSRAGAEEPTGSDGTAGPRPIPLPTGDIPPPHLLELLCECHVPEALCRKLIGQSPEIDLVRHLIVRAAGQTAPVLILGATGTGKEIVARAVHDLSERCNRGFVPVNCGAIPRELFESELFGHVKGAFTGALYDKDGLWKVAGAGTLFLDEIGDLSLEHQAKVLRVLEHHEIRPVGAKGEEHVHACVIAATNRDLYSMVQHGQFREDLYYRLRSFTIRTPALCAHAQDIPLLAQSAWRDITGDAKATLPPELLTEVQAQHWPGNVRELKMVLASLHALFGKDRLSLRHLRAVLEHQRQADVSPPAPPSSDPFGLYRIECLQHLRQADDTARACKVGARPVVADRRTDQAAVALVQATVRQRLEELDTLCLHPLRFHSETAFLIIYRLKGKLSHFQSLLATDVAEAVSYWKRELSEQFKLAVHAVFQEIEQLLKGE